MIFEKILKETVIKLVEDIPDEEIKDLMVKDFFKLGRKKPKKDLINSLNKGEQVAKEIIENYFPKKLKQEKLNI